MAQRVDAARGHEILDRLVRAGTERLEISPNCSKPGAGALSQRKKKKNLSFLKIIQEAKKAVETWAESGNREASRDNSAVDCHG